jgi:hypothetical protein
MLQKLFLIAALLGLAATPAKAATFEVSAAVDRIELELGEPMRYNLSLQVSGSFDFPVQFDPDPPKFEGFQVRGPGHQGGMAWINGVITKQDIYTWELVPIKVGTLVIPSIKASGKDAANGEQVKTTAAFTIKVKRPKDAYKLPPLVAPTPLPTYALNAQPTLVPDEEDLNAIKPDRGPPWLPIGGLLAGFGAVLALLAWLARRAPKPVPVANGRAIAFRELDAALQRLAQGDQRGFTIGVSQALRGYLRLRFDLRHEVTLVEAVAQCLRRLPDAADREKAANLRLRLELLLYGDAKFETADKDFLNLGSRALIDTIERLAGR